VFLVGSRFEIAAGQAAMMPPILRIKNAAEQARLRLYRALMTAEMREGAPGSALVAQNLSRMILAQALRLSLADVPKEDRGWVSALADPNPGTVLRAMQNDPGRAWTPEALGRTAGMSRTSIAQQFRSRVGETPMGFLARWRRMSAAALLAEGQHAVLAGFNRVTGSPPGQVARTHWHGSARRASEPVLGRGSAQRAERRTKSRKARMAALLWRLLG
jgi:AraC-like DNA-binding protein